MKGLLIALASPRFGRLVTCPTGAHRIGQNRDIPVNNANPPVAIVSPLTIPLPQAPAATGLSRSAIYRAAGEGKIRLLKNGRSTLVDMASVRTFLANLPSATVRTAA